MTTSGRLFTALWPDDALRSALAAESAAWTYRRAAAPVRSERLHLTLHFIGDLDRERLAPLQQALRRVPVEPFEFELAARDIWPNGVALLRPRDVPQAFMRLHEHVGAALQQLGIERDPRRYKPHVTLARRAGGALFPAAPLALRWRVDAFVLVESERQPVQYRVLQTVDGGSPPAPRRSPDAR